MNLRDYIAAIGDELAAKTLGITLRSARAYRTGTRLPRPAKAAQMVRKSKGKLTMDGIYGRT